MFFTIVFSVFYLINLFAGCGGAEPGPTEHRGGRGAAAADGRLDSAGAARHQGLQLNKSAHPQTNQMDTRAAVQIPPPLFIF